MGGENSGKPLFKMDDLGGKPLFCGNIHIIHDLPLGQLRGLDPTLPGAEEHRPLEESPHYGKLGPVG